MAVAPYTGSGEIPAGAFSDTEPCPPGGSHDYRFEVTALDAAGDTELGRGQATKPFRPSDPRTSDAARGR